MKLMNLKSLWIAAIAMGASYFAQAEERVLAIVDGYPVMESQVRKVLGKKANTPASHKAALEQVIDDVLVQKAVQESGLKINYQQVDLMIEDMAARNGLTYGQFLDALDYQGITYEQYRQQIAHQMLMQEVRNISIGKSIQLSPEEVQTFGQQLLEKDKTSGKLKPISGTEYRISHILLKLTPLLDDAKAKAQLTQLIADIKAGKTTFEEAAKKYSQDYLSGADGGDLGFNFLEIYDPAFSAVAKKSKAGVISAPFKSQFGWHILKVTDTRQGDRTEEAYRQKAYQQLVDKQAQEASKDWIKALRKTAEIKYIDK